MTAPVAAAPSLRAPRPPGNDGDSNSGAPFASALHGALNAGRDHDVAASPRRSQQPDERPDGGQRRAAGRDRADRPALPQPPGARAYVPGERSTRRATDRGRDETPSPSADDRDTSGDATDAVEASAAAAVNPAWVLPPVPALPTTSPADAPGSTATVAGVDAAGAPSATSTGSVAATPQSVTLDLPTRQPSDDPAAAPAQDPGSAAPVQPPVAPGGPVLTGPSVRGTVPGAAGAPVPSTDGRPSTPSSAVPVPLPAASGDAPALVSPPLLPAGPPPAWARTATAATAASASAPQTDATADALTALPDTGAASVAPAPVTADSASSDTGDTSRQDPGVPVADPSAAVVAPQTVAPASPVARVATPTTTAPPAPVATQVATQVVALSQGPDATHSVTLVLHPDNLGPVHVQMTLDRGAVDLTLRGAHEHGRAALVDALPDLRRDLEAAGLSCSKLDVDRDTGGSWSSRQQSAQQQAAQQQWAEQSRRQAEWSDGRVRPWSRTADSGDSRQVAAPTTRSTSRGVDFRV